MHGAVWCFLLFVVMACYGVATDRFIMALASEDVAGVKMELDNGVAVDSCLTERARYTALHFAARHDLAEMTALLLLHGADIDVRSNGMTAMHICAMHGSTNAFKVLLDDPRGYAMRDAVSGPGKECTE